jgi:hypothetical protein
MGRWLLMYGKRERTMAFPPRETDVTVFERQELARLLSTMKDTPYDTFCQGLDETAQKLWSSWYNALQNRDHAWDTGLSRMGKSWSIDYPTLEFAIAVAELHLKSVISLAERLVDHPDAQVRRTVLKQFRRQNDIVSVGEILRATKMRKRTVLEVLEGLVLEGQIQELPIQNNGNKLFERCMSDT